MADGEIVEISDTTFDSEVLKSNTPVLIDFWAPWCGPCRILAPIIKEISDSYSGKIKVGKINVDENQLTTMKYSIRSIPTLIVFKDGNALEQIIGAVPKSEIERLINKIL
ncbi:MAG: thioredoxin [Thermodesulfobacteriota bacterium]